MSQPPANLWAGIMQRLADRWNGLWLHSTSSSPPQLLNALLDAWREPQRHFHTLQHLEECLTLFEVVRAEASRPTEIELALWFHDAVYDVHAHDNEARSARWAAEALTEAGLAPDSVRRIHDLIMATCHGTVPSSSTGPDTALLIDIDLAILGAPAERFAEYERQIRAEYAWVAPEMFAVKRRAVLRGFLDRPTIYATPILQQGLEQRARLNLQRTTTGSKPALPNAHQ